MARAFGGVELAIIVGSVGGVIFLINLLVAAGEVEHVRQQAPQRVVEDEAAAAPAAGRAEETEPVGRRAGCGAGVSQRLRERVGRGDD